MSRPICLKCGLTMRCKRNGQPVLVTSDPGKKQAYQLLIADAYECSGCGAWIAARFGQPVEQHEDRFKETLDHIGDDYVRAF